MRAPRSSPKPMPAGLRVVVIASSTGGPAALVRILPELATHGLAHFLFLFVERFLLRLFPEKKKIAHHRHEPLRNRSPRRQHDRAVIAEIV